MSGFRNLFSIVAKRKIKKKVRVQRRGKSKTSNIRKKKISKRKSGTVSRSKKRGSTKRIAKKISVRVKTSTRIRRIKLISRTNEAVDIIKYVIEFSKKYHKSIDTYLYNEAYFQYLYKKLLQKFVILRKKRREKFLIALTYIFKLDGQKRVSQYSMTIAKIKNKDQLRIILDRTLKAFLKSSEDYASKGFEKILIVGTTIKGYK